MTNPIPNFERVFVRGRFIDMVKAAAGESAIGVSGTLKLAPSVKPGALVNPALRQIIATGSFSFPVHQQTGVVAGAVYATDDTDVTPTNWTYLVTEPVTGRTYSINVPKDTPVLNAPGDPLHGERVLELSAVIPAATPSPGVVQMIAGRELSALEVEDGNFVATYSDASTAVVGPAPTGGGSEPAPASVPKIREVLHDSEPDNNVGTITFTTGAGTKAGDTIVVVHGADWNHSDGMLAPGGGISSWAPETVAGEGNNVPHLKVWSATAASDGAKTITINRIANFSESYFGAVFVFEGSAKIEGAAVAAGASSVSHVAPSMTPDGANRLLLCAFQAGYSGSANQSYTAAPAGMTQRTLDSEGAATGGVGAMLTATEELTGTSATGTRTATFGEARPWAAVSLLVGPVDALTVALAQVPSLEELEQSVRLGDVAADATLALGVAQSDERIASLALVGTGNIATDASNYWTVSLVRYRAGSPTTVVSRYTTPTAPWGTPAAAWESWSFDLVAWDEEARHLRRGDVLALAFSRSGSPTAWQGVAATWRYEPGVQA